MRVKDLFDEAEALVNLIESRRFVVNEVAVHFSADHYADITIDVFEDRHSNIEIDSLLAAIYRQRSIISDEWYNLVFQLDGYDVDFTEFDIQTEVA